MQADGPSFLIVGTPRSGTTLVQRLASELPGVEVPPETHFLSLDAERLVRGGGFPLTGGRLVDELRRYASRPETVDLGLDAADVATRLGGSAPGPLAVFAAIVRSLAEDAPHVGEKTPDHLLWVEPVVRRWPATRVVAVVRDPRAVVASNLRVPFGMATPVVLAQRWSEDQRLVHRAADVLGDRVLVLRYEDVVADPDAARAAIAGHLGLAVSDPSAVSVPVSSLRHGWETWKQRVDGEITGERAAAWEEELEPAIAEAVAAVCAAPMDAFGYDPGLDAAAARRRRLALGPADQRRRLHLVLGRRRRLRLIGGVTA